MAIKLVIAQNVHDRSIGEVAPRPAAAFAANMNVTGEHDDVRVRPRYAGNSEFQVQIAENVQAHGSSYVEGTDWVLPGAEFGKRIETELFSEGGTTLAIRNERVASRA